MAADPRIRASDDDRDRVASLLREHYAAGRLTMEEFNERLDLAYAARTLGELDELLSDLPSIDIYRLPDASLPWYRGPASGHGSHFAIARLAGQDSLRGGRSISWRGVAGAWLAVSLICAVVWALGRTGSPWLAWLVAWPWVAVLLGLSLPEPGRRHACGGTRRR
jgi:hypothetical protein